MLVKMKGRVSWNIFFPFSYWGTSSSLSLPFKFCSQPFLCMSHFPLSRKSFNFYKKEDWKKRKRERNSLLKIAVYSRTSALPRSWRTRTNNARNCLQGVIGKHEKNIFRLQHSPRICIIAMSCFLISRLLFVITYTKTIWVRNRYWPPFSYRPTSRGAFL